MSGGRLARWWFSAAPPERLATLRILIGGFAVLHIVFRGPALIGVAYHAVEQFKPVGPVQLLPAPLPPFVVIALVVAAVGFGVAFVLGWRYRVTGPAFAILFLWVTSYRNSWGMVFHTENLAVLHVVVLSVARAADAYALDQRRCAGPPHESYGWPIRLLCAVAVATYVIAGVTKLRLAGIEWITSDTLRNFVAYDNVRKIELGASHSVVGAAMVAQSWLFPPFAAFSMAVELGAPLALLGRRAGYVWSVMAWGFHAGVLVVMFIAFPYQLSGVALTPFFKVERLAALVRGWLARSR